MFRKILNVMIILIMGLIRYLSLPAMNREHRSGFAVTMASVLWLVGTLVVSSVYRSNLKAMLIIPKVNLPFDNLEELVEAGTPTMVIESSLLHRSILVSNAWTK